MAALGTVYWGYKGTHGSTRVSMVGLLGTCGGIGEQYGVSIEGRLTEMGCPLDPLNHSRGGSRGIPWPHKKTRGTVPAGMYIA